MTKVGWRDFIVWQCSLRQRNFRMFQGKPSEGIICKIYDKKNNKLNILKSENDDLEEINKDNPELIILEGGLGGRGNFHFKSSTNQTPRYSQKGIPGKEISLILELNETDLNIGFKLFLKNKENIATRKSSEIVLEFMNKYNLNLLGIKNPKIIDTVAAIIP